MKQKILERDGSWKSPNYRDIFYVRRVRSLAMNIKTAL